MAPLPRGRETIVPRVIEEKARHQVGQRRAGLRRKRLPGWILRWADAVWHAEQLDLHASGLMPMMTLLLPSHRPPSESDRERPRLHQNPASSMMRPR
jgi:hypothetical protein